MNAMPSPRPRRAGLLALSGLLCAAPLLLGGCGGDEAGGPPAGADQASGAASDVAAGAPAPESTTAAAASDSAAPAPTPAPAGDSVSASADDPGAAPVAAAAPSDGTAGADGAAQAPDVDPRTADVSKLEDVVRDKIVEARKVLDLDPTDPARWLTLAYVYHANFLPTLAVLSYDEALKLQPDRAMTWYQRALAQDSLGKRDAATPDLQHALELDPTVPSFHWRHGDWLFEQGDLDAARAEYQKTLDLDDANPAAQTGMARIAMQEDHYPEAIKLLSGVLDGNEDLPFANYVRGVLATAYRRNGEEERAGALEAVGTTGPPAWYDPAEVEIARHGADTLFNIAARATALANQKKFDEAAQEMAKVVAATPDEPARRDQYARFLALSGKFDDAITQYRETLTRSPDDREALVALGRLLGQKGDTDEALSMIDHAIELEPLYAPAYFFRGAILRRQGKIQEAVDAYRRSVELDESKKTPWVAVGLLELQLQHWDPALKAFERAEALGLDRGDMWLGKADALLELGRLDECEKLLTTLRNRVQQGDMDRSFDPRKMMGLQLALRGARAKAAQKDKASSGDTGDTSGGTDGVQPPAKDDAGGDSGSGGTTGGNGR